MFSNVYSNARSLVNICSKSSQKFQCSDLNSFLEDSVLRVNRLRSLLIHSIRMQAKPHGTNPFVRDVYQYSLIFQVEFEDEVRKINKMLPSDTFSFENMTDDDSQLWRLQYLMVREFIDQLDFIVQGVLVLKQECGIVITTDNNKSTANGNSSKTTS